MAKAAKKPPTKTELFTNIATATDLTRKDVAAVFAALETEVKKVMGPRGAGAVTIPGLVKLQKKKVPARPAEKNWKNPFTGEVQTRPAKPASKKVVVRPVKNLKDMV